MKSCFFTGHRYAPSDTQLIAKTGDVIVELITKKGVTEFYAGGAVGWDTICASLVLSLKGIYPQINLNLILPCPPGSQTARWSNEQRERFNSILKRASSIEIVSPKYTTDCMKKRNARLVELGEVCICYFNKNDFRSGTAQTVRMAEESGKEIINMYEPSENKDGS